MGNVFRGVGLLLGCVPNDPKIRHSIEYCIPDSFNPLQIHTEEHRTSKRRNSLSKREEKHVEAFRAYFHENMR
jgi:hypothetical protein